MTYWSVWEEISRVMAVLCLITSLAAVTAAVILLVHEELTDWIRGALKAGVKRRTGILMLAAAGVWIFVIGQSVSAAEVSGNGDNGAAPPAGTASTEFAAQTEPGTASGDPADPGEEPGTVSGDPADPGEEPDPDVRAPEVSIEMAQKVNRDGNGTIYCRADNAGVRVRFADEGQEDSGIVSYLIVLSDERGKEIRREGSTGEKVVEVEIGTEKAASLFEGEIRVTAQAEDACGNLGSGEISFILDMTAPVFTVQVSQPAGNPAGIDEKNGIVYYGGDPGQYPEGTPVITADFRVKDRNTDPGRLQVRTAYAAVPEGGSCEQVLPDWNDSLREECRVREEGGRKGSTEQVLLTLRRFPGNENTPDGVYRFGIEGTDKAGNPIVPENKDAGDGLFGLVCENAREGAYMTGKKVVDTKAPGGELRIENESGDVYCRLTAGSGSWESEEDLFMPFRREKSAVIAFSASDTSPAGVSFRIVSTAGDGNDTPPDGGSFGESGRPVGGSDPGEGGSNGGSGEDRILVRGGQIFRLEDLIVKDRAGNASAVLASTESFYLDTAAPEADIEAPAVKVRAVPEITYYSPDGRPLYGGPVSLEIFAADPDRRYGGSGLEEVHLSVEIEGETAREEVLFQEEEENGEDPAYEYYGRITVPASGRWESNDIEVSVTAQDRAGNRSDSADSGTFRFGTDISGPQVSVSYDNNEVRSGRYFDRDRTATVSVRERNFDREKIRIRTPGALAGDWVRGTDSEPDLWTMEVRFSLDGAYTLEVSGGDALGNPASAVYSGEAPQEFVIDRTPPLVEVLWDNNDVRNGKYYNRERRATIRVTDLSFDERMVKTAPFARPFRRVSETAEDRTAGMIPVYEAEIPFTEEGEWTLRCMCADLSGNAAAPVPEETFIIDKTAPMLFFDTDSVRERGSCGGEISPVLRCEEENPAPGSLFARWDNLTAGGRLLACRRGSDGSAVLPDPPQEREADGVYLLSGTACDLAGNRAMVRRNLCVNRFGSLYDISEDEKTLEMINDYYTDAADPFVIAEYNVSPITERQITLYKNGSARILEEGKDYSVTEERRGSGFRYLCRIDPSAYREEGKYSFLVESRDESGNYSSSPGRFTSGPEYTASFAVDRTPPTVRLAGVDTARRKYVAESVPVRFILSDNMELGGLDIEITDDRGSVLESQRIGKEELRDILEQNGGEVPFEIRASGKWQTLRAFAVDGAGNRSVKIEGLGKTKETGAGTEKIGGEGTDEDGYRVLVSANLMVHLYRSGILPAIAFLALVSAIHYGYTVYKRTLA